MAQLRTLVVPVGVIAAVLLFLLVNPWIVLEGTISQVVTVAFWLSFILLLIILFSLRDDPDAENIEVEGPAFTRFLFNNPRAGLFWLPIRLFVGFQWLEAGWHKVTDPAWVGPEAGTAILGFWQNAVAIPEEGRPSITYEWYRTFLQFLIDSGAEQFFSYAIAFGELFVGIGLLVGALTGIAAFFGALMNMSFLLAGSASTNPIMFTLAVGLMLAWKVAGYYGLDRYLLPLLGTPWRQRAAAREEHEAGAASG
jgi:thiosulfate dehydrogenase (quinone) large subunit